MIAEPADARARLVALSAERKVSLAALSALLGRNSAYLQQFVRKGSPRKLEEGDRRTLARYFGVAETELGAPAAEIPAPANDWAEIPRLAAAASAGPGAIGAADSAFGTIRFSKAWLRHHGLDPARLSAIAVSGDSMEPSLKDGDEILVEATPNPPRGAIHVVRIGDALMVKRLERPAPDRVVLLSENPAYPPVELPGAEVAVLGRVVWKSGRV
jgi:phage repressor protein C with HTH and peptisase S24 domain